MSAITDYAAGMPLQTYVVIGMLFALFLLGLWGLKALYGTETPRVESAIVEERVRLSVFGGICVALLALTVAFAVLQAIADRGPGNETVVIAIALAAGALLGRRSNYTVYKSDKGQSG